MSKQFTTLNVSKIFDDGRRVADDRVSINERTILLPVNELFIMGESQATIEKLGNEVSSRDPGNEVAAERDVLQISHFLEMPGKITRIELNDQMIGDACVQKLAAALVNNDTVTNVYLSDNNITAIGAKYIKSLFEHNRTICTLSIKRNNLGDIGAEEIGKMLRTTKTLRFLIISHNNIGNEGAIAIAKGLCGNESMQYLFIDHNIIGNAGFVEIAAALREHKFLHHLHVNNNCMGEIGAIAIANVLENNTTIKQLFLHENIIRDAGAVAFSKVLTKNKTLFALQIANNGIGEIGALAIAKSLEINNTLKRICIYNNNIGKTCGTAFVKTLKYNKVVQEINLANSHATSATLRTVNARCLKNKNMHTKYFAILSNIADTIGHSRNPKTTMKLEKVETEIFTNQRNITAAQYYLDVGPLIFQHDNNYNIIKSIANKYFLFLTAVCKNTFVSLMDGNQEMQAEITRHLIFSDIVRPKKNAFYKTIHESICSLLNL